MAASQEGGTGGVDQCIEAAQRDGAGSPCADRQQRLAQIVAGRPKQRGCRAVQRDDAVHRRPHAGQHAPHWHNVQACGVDHRQMRAGGCINRNHGARDMAGARAWSLTARKAAVLKPNWLTLIRDPEAEQMPRRRIAPNLGTEIRHRVGVGQ